MAKIAPSVAPVYQKAPMAWMATAAPTASRKHARPKPRSAAATGTSIQRSRGRRSVM